MGSKRRVFAAMEWCRKRILAANSCSRSFFLQSITGRQGSAYRYIILLALSLKIRKKSPFKWPKTAVVEHPTLIWRPRQEEPTQVSAWALYFQKLRSLDYIFVASCMGVSSLTFVQLAQKDASLLQQSACRKRILAANSCSRSFILQSFAGRQGLAYRHNTAGLISVDSDEVATQMAKNCRIWQPRSYLTYPKRGDVKWEWGCWRWQFLAIWMATSAGSSEIRPAILYDEWPWLTSNGYLPSKSVFSEHSVAAKMRLLEPIAQIWIKIDPYNLRLKCSPMILVSGNLGFMGIFVGVPVGGGVKWEWGGRRRQFLAIWMATSSESSEIRPVIC